MTSKVSFLIRWQGNGIPVVSGLAKVWMLSGLKLEDLFDGSFWFKGSS